jgi:hypothetical protein
MDRPITPPPELVQQWIDLPLSGEEILVTAYRAGADQELEACCAAMDDWGNIHHSCGLDLSNFLRAARRPKPPSLKEQALALIEPQGSPARLLNEDQMGIIRRALEQLDD